MKGKILEFVDDEMFVESSECVSMSSSFFTLLNWVLKLSWK